jgi:UDP-N-acetylglucosamine acyltransferase
MYGINVVGLRRAGLSRDERLVLQRAFRLLFNSSLTPTAALERIRTDFPSTPQVARVVEFFSRSGRGVLV